MTLAVLFERPEELQAAIERCWQEISDIEALLLAGHPDVEGLCLALSDWAAELRLIESGMQSGEPNPE